MANLVRIQKAYCWKQDKVTQHRVTELEPIQLKDNKVRRESIWQCLECKKG